VRVSRRRKLPRPLERQTQGTLAQLLDIAIEPGWVWTSSAVGGYRPTAHRNPGIKKGWPDIQLLDPTGRFHGLELKRGKKKLRPEQIAFQDHCRRHSIPYQVAVDDDQAIAILRQWGAIRKVRVQ
jgi:hypothetical protein